MKTLLKFIIGFMLLGSALFIAKPAKASPEFRPAPTLCPPGVYQFSAIDCLPAGPSEYLTHYAKTGIVFPIQKIPGIKPDPNLNYVPYQYGLVRTPNAPVYGSIEDALKARKKNAIRRIESGFSYVSYLEETYIDGKRLYMVDPGGWMTANDVIRVTAPVFQGLEFAKTPPRPFGWVLTYLSPTPYVETKRTPGFAANDYTGHYLKNHEVVWVYETREVNGVEWSMIGPDEWIEHKVIAKVIPNPTPPQGVDNGRWIEVNLYEQTIAVYDNYELVFATIIASGLEPFWTRPGLFQIYEKLESTPMSGAFEADRSDAYYLEDVPWTMYFDEARALHGAYWRANLGFPQSHGCVNLSIGDAHWLYNWANIGDFVYVWDPSGKTPEDPSLYTKGGA